MKVRVYAAAMVMLGAAVAAHAGDLHGKVSGAKGESVVYVNAIAGKTFPAPNEHQVMNQKGLMFQPHIMVVQQGTTVDFLNSDSVAHNVFWPSVNGNKKLGHNLGTWPQGDKRSFTFSEAGVVPLFCNVHPDMSGYIIVSPTPYYATTNAAGEYVIRNVPNGTYSVTAWHEGDKPHTSQVTVAGDTALDITVSR
ncbi:MAG: carboxypeptidase regulatory-like domain-containing protein [Acidobacteriaceae bacterium]